jgi:hypothetical protein
VGGDGSHPALTATNRRTVSQARPAPEIPLALTVLRDIVVGGTQVAATTLTAPVARRHYNRWGATDDKVADAMPGDELVPEPRMTYTRAVTVAASPQPGVAVAGADRAGPRGPLQL